MYYLDEEGFFHIFIIFPFLHYYHFSFFYIIIIFTDITAHLSITTRASDVFLASKESW